MHTPDECPEWAQFDGPYAALEFDRDTQEYARFECVAPKRWDEDAITFEPVWGALKC